MVRSVFLSNICRLHSCRKNATATGSTWHCYVVFLHVSMGLRTSQKIRERIQKLESRGLHVMRLNSRVRHCSRTSSCLMKPNSQAKLRTSTRTAHLGPTAVHSYKSSSRILISKNLLTWKSYVKNLPKPYISHKLNPNLNPETSQGP